MSKTASAFMTGMKRADAKSDKVDTPPAKGSGNWSKMALDSMENSLKESREALGLALTTLRQGVVEGTVPINIPANQITDVIGTDRISDATEEEDVIESFQSLVENIRRRGLRTPLRARPINPDWRPSDDDPLNPGEQTFALQSGRRRLAACQELGITPTVFLSFEPDDSQSADLEERFFENAARKNLTLVEKLYSIGLIADGMAGQSQANIATAIGANAAYVSRGIAVVEYFDRLKVDIDLAEATARVIDKALKKYRSEKEPSSDPNAQRSREHRKKRMEDASLPFKKQNIGDTLLTLKTNGKGERILSLRGKDLHDDTIARIVKIIESEGGAGG